jgi:MFS transporter, DHA3 family, tetracycline resistance protein
MRKRGAAFIYLTLNGASSFCYAVILPVEIVYLIKAVGFNPLQLVLIGTLRQSIAFLFQLPTGALADMYSRRWAVILGILLTGMGYLIEGAFPVFAVVLVAQIFWGFGTTLTNGADTAWIADEIGIERAGPVYLHAAQVGSLTSLLGIALSAALVNVHLNLSLVLGGSLFIALSILLAGVMPEQHFTPAPRENRSTFRQMGYTVRAGIQLVRLRPVLLTILSVAVFSGVFSAGFDQLWNYYLLHRFVFPALAGLIPVTWFSVIEVGIVITNFCGISLVRRFIDTQRYRAVVGALLVVDGLTIMGVLGFVVAGQFFLALAAFFLLTTARGPRSSLQPIWMNHDLDSTVRATLFSLQGQVNSIAQIVGGPLLGIIATAFSTGSALIASAIMLSPTLLLYALTLRHANKKS